MTLDQFHFAAFKKMVANLVPKDSGSRKSPHRWAASTNLGARLPDEIMTRESLLQLVADPKTGTPEICWSILAWGGMHGKNRDALIELRAPTDEWLRVAEAVRRGTHSRESAYDAFFQLKEERKLPGMGPAYYTKLIFFLMPRNGHERVGYIMDQWLGCSINLLVGDEVVLMDCTHSWKRVKGVLELSSDFTVSKFNDGARYEQFCSCVEEVAAEIGKEPEMVELLLMSGGGKTKQAWRKHVIKHRRLMQKKVR